MFESIVALLDAGHAAARRPEPGEPVWLGGGGDWAAGERLLAAAVRALLAVGRSCFLLTDGSAERADLGVGGWEHEPVAPGTWRVPPSLDAGRLVESPLHALGNYAIYARDGPLADGLPPGLPWWGPSPWRGRAARLLAGLRAAGVEAALAVHPDGTEWVAAIPGRAANSLETGTA